MKLEDDGLIAKYNKDHPEAAAPVEKSDRIVSINNVTGAENIQKAMKEQLGNLSIRIKRKIKSNHAKSQTQSFSSFMHTAHTRFSCADVFIYLF